MSGPTPTPVPDKPLVSPFCAHLRTKKWAFLSRPARTEEELLDGSQASWCGCTHKAVGPDCEIVDPLDCQRGRTCFVSIV